MSICIASHRWHVLHSAPTSPSNLNNIVYVLHYTTMACVALRTYKPLTTKIELSNIVCVLHYTPMACAALRTYKPLTTEIKR